MQRVGKRLCVSSTVSRCAPPRSSSGSDVYESRLSSLVAACQRLADRLPTSFERPSVPRAVRLPRSFGPINGGPTRLRPGERRCGPGHRGSGVSGPMEGGHGSAPYAWPRGERVRTRVAMTGGNASDAAARALTSFVRRCERPSTIASGPGAIVRRLDSNASSPRCISRIVSMGLE